MNIFKHQKVIIRCKILFWQGVYYLEKPGIEFLGDFVSLNIRNFYEICRYRRIFLEFYLFYLFPITLFF